MYNKQTLTRSSRGPSYIDAYEAQYDTSSNECDNNGLYNTNLMGYSLCIKNFVFLFNFIFLLIGVGLIVITFLRKEELNIFGYDIIHDNYMIYCYISIGVLITITSFLGCSGATTQTKCILIIYILLVIISIITQIIIVIYIFIPNSHSNIHDYILKYQWNDLTKDQQLNFQSMNNCIGYNECNIILQNNLNYNLNTLSYIMIFMSVYQLFMCIMSSILSVKL
eukprot:17777_1